MNGLFKSQKSLFKSQKGAVAVEMALFSPFMFLLIFTVFEVGTACYYKQLLVNASREGARYVSVESPDNLDEYVVDILHQSGFDKQVSIEYSTPPGGLVSVSVSYDYEFKVLKSLISGLSGVTLSSSTVMRHE